MSVIGVRYWMSLWDNSLLSKAYAEFMGCMIFHFIGSVSPTAISNAVALTSMVFYTAKISGGHLNPALTLTFCLLGHTDPLELLVYWVAQVSGCVVGALWIAALMPGGRIRTLPDPPLDQLVGCLDVHRGITPMQVLGWEAVATFCFIVPVFSVVWYTQNKSGYGSTGPIMVGVSLYAVALATGDWTGALVNPARTLGSDIVFTCAQSSSIRDYVGGQIIGAVLAPLAIVPWYGLSARPWYGRILIPSMPGAAVLPPPLVTSASMTVPEKRYACASPTWAPSLEATATVLEFVAEEPTTEAGQEEEERPSRFRLLTTGPRPGPGPRVPSEPSEFADRV